MVVQFSGDQPRDFILHKNIARFVSNSRVYCWKTASTWCYLNAFSDLLKFSRTVHLHITLIQLSNYHVERIQILFHRICSLYPADYQMWTTRIQECVYQRDIHSADEEKWQLIKVWYIVARDVDSEEIYFLIWVFQFQGSRSSLKPPVHHLDKFIGGLVVDAQTAADDDRQATQCAFQAIGKCYQQTEADCFQSLAAHYFQVAHFIAMMLRYSRPRGSEERRVDRYLESGFQ